MAATMISGGMRTLSGRWLLVAANASAVTDLVDEWSSGCTTFAIPRRRGLVTTRHEQLDALDGLLAQMPQRFGSEPAVSVRAVTTVVVGSDDDASVSVDIAVGVPCFACRLWHASLCFARGCRLRVL
jgi:hypothetical protein